MQWFMTVYYDADGDGSCSSDSDGRHVFVTRCHAYCVAAVPKSQ
jgi:hypothetical protein